MNERTINNVDQIGGPSKNVLRNFVERKQVVCECQVNCTTDHNIQLTIAC